jgi:hypothetical protein
MANHGRTYPAAGKFVRAKNNDSFSAGDQLMRS